MANLMRNDLVIEGDNPKTVLDAISSDPDGAPIVWNAKGQPENIGVIIDFNRIVPCPKERPAEGWGKWVWENWGATLYDDFSDGDIFELTENKVSFKFYTRSNPAFPVIETLAKRFPQFTVRFRSWELMSYRVGQAEWKNGMRTVFVPMFGLKTKSDADEPANDPVTDEMKAAAAQSVRAAAESCQGLAPDTNSAERIVAEVMAASGRAVAVIVEPNEDGSFYLSIEA
jgi:hypothetical protein